MGVITRYDIHTKIGVGFKCDTCGVLIESTHVNDSLQEVIDSALVMGWGLVNSSGYVGSLCRDCFDAMKRSPEASKDCVVYSSDPGHSLPS